MSLLAMYPSSISKEHNLSLKGEVTLTELKEVVSSMQKDKSLGLNGGL